MSAETKQILTTDGIPLEVSLKKAERKKQDKSFFTCSSFTSFLINHLHFSNRRYVNA